MALAVKSNGEIKFFGISKGVGKGLLNAPTDCMLVLYLLYKYATYSTGMPNDIGVPSFDPSRDFGDQEIVSNAILTFQRHFNKLSQGFPKSGKLKEDGKANCPHDWFGQKPYTIIQLNYSYQASVITFFNNSVDPIKLALDDNKMPVWLRTELIASSVFYGVL